MTREEIVKRIKEEVLEDLNPDSWVRNRLENIFPELVKSEDDKIITGIESIIKYYKDKGETVCPYPFVNLDECLDWLKSTKNKSDTNNGLLENFKDEDYKNMFRACNIPKFNEGDWIISKYMHLVMQILNNDNGSYKTVETDGTERKDSYDFIERNFKLWTIQDVQDGDVIVYRNTATEIIMLFKSLRNIHFAFTHFHIYNDGDYRVNDWCDCGENAHPATKEQRDLLFQKMKEAGYEWDAEKKELKKIHVIDEGKAEMDYCFTKMMNGEKVSLTWSEEDDNKINSIKYLLHELDNHNFDNWLKSLKDRIHVQNLTVTDEELSQAKKDAYNDALDKIEYHSGEPTFDDGWDAAIWYLKKRNIQPQLKQEWNEEDEKMLNDILMCGERHCYLDAGNIAWLKSLKERVQLQPKQEWNEEDEKTLNEIFSVAARASLRKSTLFGKSYDYIKWQNWLKSLKGRVQPKQEWGEEDEKRIKNILSVLDVQVCWDGATGKKENTYQKEIDWLKSLKPNKRTGQWDVSDFRTWQYIVSDVLTKKDGIGQYLDNGFCKKIAKYMQEEWSKKLS